MRSPQPHTLFNEQEEINREKFKEFLERRILSDCTIKQYLTYYNKFKELMNETGESISQMLIDAFLDVYPHIVCRAFLNSFLEFMNIKDITIPRRRGRVAKKEIEIIPKEDAEKIRDELYNLDERFGLSFDISMACALRRQEVLNIKAKEIKIEQEDKMFILIRGKGKRERIVFVPKYVALLIIHYCFANNLRPSDYLFRSKMHPEKSVDPSAWNRIFTKASLRAVGKRYHPHQLRHSRTTEWFEKGIDIVRIQQRLGHSSIATTRLYINPDSKTELKRWSNEAE